MKGIVVHLRALSIHALVVTALFWAQDAMAHEVRPAVADLTITADQVNLEIRLNAEAVLAGVNLSVVSDTNDSEQAEAYDTLRALSDTALEDAVRQAWPEIAAGLALQSGSEALVPELRAVAVQPEPDLESPRDTIVTVTAALPPGEDPVQVGWVTDYGSLVLRQQGEVDAPFTGMIAAGEQSPPLPRTGSYQETASETFGRYLVSGFDHIIPKGLDHILFVLGLFFFSLKMRPLLIQVTSFTLAHTLTLGLATAGVISLSPAIVEPLIAASIVYVAVENILTRRMTPWRPVVIFGFGLLHGLGFATVLAEFGLSTGHFVASLVAFNIGVELGQLTVIAVAYLAVGYWFGDKPWYRARIAVPASVAIALVGAYWFAERVFF